jgi:hypothetical protein
MEFSCLDDGQDIGDALAALVGAGEEPIFSSNCHLPDILPISGKKSRSITAGMRFMVGMSDATTASSAADRKSSLSSTNPE